MGLEALLKCPRLRKISMNKNFNHSANHYAYGGITLQGVRKLVTGLPNLEFISFGSMGKILNNSEFENLMENKPPLKLIHFNELDPEFVQVERLQRLCPNLAHINLSVPISINPSGLIDANASVPCLEILKVIKKE